MSSSVDRPLQLVVHVGPHKTGTTYLQANFTARASELKARGWLYPALGERIGIAQHDLAESRDDFAAARGRAYQDFARLVARADAAGLDLLLSSEGFRRWRRPHFQALAAAAGGRRIRIAYTLRDPLDLLHSAWAQRIKAGATESLPEWMERHLAAPPDRSRLDPLAELRPLVEASGGDCTVLLYDELRRREDDLFVHFLDAVLGIEGIASAKPAANERLPIELTEFLRLLAVARGGKASPAERRRTVDPGFVLNHLFGTGEKRAIVAAVAAVETARRTLEVSRTTPRFRDIEARLLSYPVARMSPLPADGVLFSRQPAAWVHYDAGALGRDPAVARLVSDAARRLRPGNPAIVAAGLGKRALIGWRVMRKRLRI